MKPYYDHEPAYRRIAESGGSGWDDLAGTSADSYVALEAFLGSSLAPVAGDVLDLGCGGGQASLRLARAGHRVTGVDFSPTAIDLARRNLAAAVARSATTELASRPRIAEVSFLVGDCLDLAFPDTRFGLAIDNHVLHCLIGDDRTRFLREARRVLRPGGVLFSETMSREGDFDRAHADPGTFVSARGNRYWTSEAELDALFAGAGFEIVQRGRRAADPGFGDDLIRVARRP